MQSHSLLHATYNKCTYFFLILILIIPYVFLLYSGGPSSARRGNDSPPPHVAGSNGLNLPFDELPAVGAAAMSYGQYNQESKTGTIQCFDCFFVCDVELVVEARRS